MSEMTQAISGFADNPSDLLEAAFGQVAAGEMQALPFYQHQLPVRAVGFTRHEEQWVGVMLTPWLLSLMILPGPEQEWPARRLGERIGVALPCGNATFVVSELEGVGQYLSCSLQSPPTPGISSEQALKLARDLSLMITALPVTDPDAPQNPARRALFERRV